MSDFMLSRLLLTVALLWAGNCVRYVSQIGKERKPVDARYAGWDMLVNGLIIAVIVISALRLEPL